MNIWRWVAIVALVCGHLAVDLTLMAANRPRRGPSENWFFFQMGLCTSQVYLVAVWAALAPGRVLTRVVASVCLGTLMWYALVLGNQLEGWWNGDEYGYMHYPKMNGTAVLQLGIVIWAGVLVARIPVAFVAWRFRWRMFPPRIDILPTEDDRRFKISHLMFATAAISVLMALGRAVLPIDDMKWKSLDHELLVILPIVAVVGVIAVLPCVWGGFVRRSHLLPCALLWPIYIAIVTLFEFGAFTAAMGGGGPQSDFWPSLAAFNIAQCLSVFGSMLVLRAIGFRLKRLDRRMPTSDQEGESAGATSSASA